MRIREDPKPEKTGTPSKPSSRNVLTTWLKNDSEGAKNTPLQKKSGVTVKPLKDENCEFRRGVCLTHDIKGEKVTINEKKWGKKSTGFGWIYRKKVKYICRAEKFTLTVPDISTSDVSEISSTHEVRISDTRGMDDIQTGRGISSDSQEGLES